MNRACNYCWKLSENLTIVVAVERPSGPPFIQVACSTCMSTKGMKAWQP